jgi:SAM-dependent methyltransferase
LDVACGSGRNALFLAERGWRVDAVDASDVAIELLQAEAVRRGLSEQINAIVADLSGDAPGFVIAANRYDLVCDVYFLERDLFAPMRRAIRPGGRFAACIHVLDREASTSMNARFLLVPGELASLAESWGCELLWYDEPTSRESEHRRRAAELIAQVGMR